MKYRATGKGEIIVTVPTKEDQVTAIPSLAVIPKSIDFTN